MTSNTLEAFAPSKGPLHELLRLEATLRKMAADPAFERECIAEFVRTGGTESAARAWIARQQDYLAHLGRVRGRLDCRHGEAPIGIVGQMLAELPLPGPGFAEAPEIYEPRAAIDGERQGG